MSIEKIISKILNDAEENARVILDEAKAQSKEILSQAEKRAESITADAEKRGAREKEKLISRRRAVADIDGRKIILEQKQNLIAQCFEKAIDQIISRDRGQYLEFLAAAVKHTGSRSGELILNGQDAASLGEELITKLQQELPGSQIRLSKETRNIRGGFLLKNGSVYINGTIEAMLEETREELTGEVAGVLFQ